MKCIVAAMCMSFLLPSFAQKKQDTLKKNEININVLPLFYSLSLNNDAPDFAYNLRYKRSIKPSLFFRVGVEYSKSKYGSYFVTRVGQKDDEIIYLNYFKNGPSHSTRAHAGLEYRWGKKRVKFFAGTDLGFNYFKVNQQKLYAERNADQWYSFGARGLPFIDPLDSDSLISEQNIVISKLDFTPFFGVQLFFSRNFFFSTQVGRRLYYTVKDDLNYYESVFSDRRFNMSRNVIQDFSLCYRF